MYKTGKDTLEVMKLARWYNGWVLSFIERYLGGDILEVGAGIGNFSSLLEKSGDVTTIDIRKDYLRKLKKENKKRNVGFGDIEKGKYYFKKRKFDNIVCLNVLEHIKNDKGAIDNMYSLLRPGGHLILLVPAHKLLYSNFDKRIGHHRRYSVNGVDSILKNSGFVPIETRYFNWFGALGWYFFLKLSKKGKMPSGKVLTFEKIGKYFLWVEKLLRPPFGLSVLAIAQK